MGGVVHTLLGNLPTGPSSPPLHRFQIAQIHMIACTSQTEAIPAKHDKPILGFIETRAVILDLRAFLSSDALDHDIVLESLYVLYALNVFLRSRSSHI